MYRTELCIAVSVETWGNSRNKESARAGGIRVSKDGLCRRDKVSANSLRKNHRRGGGIKRERERERERRACRSARVEGALPRIGGRRSEFRGISRVTGFERSARE